MSAYYNENDAFAAAWLRNLIADKLIAPGEVDERSIEDVTPDDLRSFRQCHFFAGIGVWSAAARLAGWSDDEALWTGSAPCQPFSQAGRREGIADERHLWPSWHFLIEQCEPAVVTGEQVAGALGDAWLDAVSADLDATGYAFGVAETCAAGFGAPIERTRNYWLAFAAGAGSQGRAGRRAAGSRRQGRAAERDRAARRLAGTNGERREAGHRQQAASSAALAVPDRDRGSGGLAGSDERQCRGLSDGEGCRFDGSATRRVEGDRGAASGRFDDGLAGPGSIGLRRGHKHRGDAGAAGEMSREAREQRVRVDAGADGSSVRGLAGAASERLQEQVVQSGHGALELQPSHLSNRRPGPVNGLWADADWLLCRDARWRPVEPGTFPLVDAGTVRNRVGLLRGAGNAINLAQAAAFLEAVQAVMP